jgi:hypothetical protein
MNITWGYTLKIGNKVLDENKTVSDYGISSGSAIFIQYTHFDISITMAGGKTITLKTFPDSTISSIKD